MRRLTQPDVEGCCDRHRVRKVSREKGLGWRRPVLRDKANSAGAGCSGWRIRTEEAAERDGLGTRDECAKQSQFGGFLGWECGFGSRTKPIGTGWRRETGGWRESAWAQQVVRDTGHGARATDRVKQSQFHGRWDALDCGFRIWDCGFRRSRFCDRAENLSDLGAGGRYNGGLFVSGGRVWCGRGGLLD